MKLSVLIAAGLASLASALPLLDNTAETLVSNDTTGLDFFELGGGNFTQAESVEWKHCRAWNDNRAQVLVRDIQLDPNPPIRGQNLRIHVAATSKRKLGKPAYFKVAVMKLGVKWKTFDFDFCDHLVEGSTCPLDVGEFVAEKIQDIAANIPKWYFTLEIQVYDESHKSLSCVKIKTEVKD